MSIACVPSMNGNARHQPPSASRCSARPAGETTGRRQRRSRSATPRARSAARTCVGHAGEVARERLGIAEHLGVDPLHDEALAARRARLRQRATIVSWMWPRFEHLGRSRARGRAAARRSTSRTARVAASSEDPQRFAHASPEMPLREERHEVRALADRVAAVDRDQLARDPARVVREQEHDRLADVGGLADPRDRHQRRYSSREIGTSESAAAIGVRTTPGSTEFTRT